VPLRANLLEQMIFVNTNLGPKPVLDIWNALALPVVQAAIETGVLAALRQQPATAEELATRTGIDGRGASMLLPALESLDYVRSRQGRYELSAATEKWLMDGGAINFTAGFAFWSAVIPRLWQKLTDSLRTGEPATNLYAWIAHEPEVSKHFQEWMVALASYTLPEVLARVKIDPQARRLLDVGGGHGLYGIGFCERYPALQAIIFDSAHALLAAQTNIAAKKLGDRVSTQVGDFMEEALPPGFDVVLLFNVIHGLSMEQNGALLKKAAAALQAGGKVLIAEQLAGGGLGPLSTGINRLLGLNYFHLLGGQNYSYAHVVEWLEAAGCVALRRIDLRQTPGVSIVVGCKQ
jgi:hypothetical protein